jgi:anti-sigma regulatory factor (Ser/Thr protein kinase)
LVAIDPPLPSFEADTFLLIIKERKAKQRPTNILARAIRFRRVPFARYNSGRACRQKYDDATNREMIHQKKFGAALGNLDAMRVFMAEKLEECGAEKDLIEAVVYSANEMTTNIIEHGYEDEGGGEIEITVEKQDGQVVVRLRDHAPPFDPTEMPDPDVSLPLEERPLGGMGVYLTKKFLDDFSHRVLPEGGNELVLIKRFPKESAA